MNTLKVKLLKHQKSFTHIGCIHPVNFNSIYIIAVLPGTCRMSKCVCNKFNVVVCIELLLFLCLMLCLQFDFTVICARQTHYLCLDSWNMLSGENKQQLLHTCSSVAVHYNVGQRSVNRQEQSTGWHILVDSSQNVLYQQDQLLQYSVLASREGQVILTIYRKETGNYTFSVHQKCSYVQS